MLDYQRKFLKDLFSNAQNNNISIYRNNYYGRTLQALQILYPATERCLGEEFFQQVAISFAKNYVPKHSHLHGYHFKFIKYLSNTPQTFDIKYLKYLMYYEYLREISNNAHKLNHKKLESAELSDVLRLDSDVIPFKSEYNIDAVYDYCMDMQSDLTLEKKIYHYLLYRDNDNIIQCDRVDYATYNMAKLLYKNKNLTLEAVFAKLSVGEDDFAKIFSHFIIKKLLVKER